MKRVIIVHRWDGTPEADWYLWLAQELAKQGHQVIVPQMPDTATPVIEKWISKLIETVGTPDANTYFVAHSIGCQTVLRYLQTITTPIGGAVFVAGWFDLKNLESPEVAEIAAPWIHTPINMEQIRTVLPISTLVISNNDPYDCFEYNKKKFSALGSKIVVVSNGGHLTADDGYTECQEFLEECNRVI